MRGLFYSSDDCLPESDMQELADALALTLHNLMGDRVFLLHRLDVAELLEPYICDLSAEDQATVPWIVWDLFQEAQDIALGSRR